MALLPNGFDKLLPISSRMNLIEPPLNCVFPVSTCLRPVIAFRHSSVSFSRVKASSSRRRLDVHSSVSPASENRPWIEFPRAFIKASASSLILVALGIFTFSFSNKVNTRYALAAVDPAGRPTVQEESIDEGEFHYFLMIPCYILNIVSHITH